MSRPSGRRPRGLTLVEFLFATSITAFVMLGVAGMFPSALRSVVVGGHMTKASILAQQMIDALRNEPFDPIITRYNGFDSRTISTTCPPAAPVTTFDAEFSKKKWKCDLIGDGAQAEGKGLPRGYGVVSVTCRNPTDGAAVVSNPCSTGLVRAVVTVYWERDAARSVSYTADVVRAE